MLKLFDFLADPPDRAPRQGKPSPSRLGESDGGVTIDPLQRGGIGGSSAGKIYGLARPASIYCAPDISHCRSSRLRPTPVNLFRRVSMSRTGPLTPQNIESARIRAREKLTELRALSSQLDDCDVFYTSWLAYVLEVTSADVGIIWMSVEGSHWNPAFRSGAGSECDLEIDPFEADRKVELAEAIRSAAPRAAVLNAARSSSGNGAPAGTAVWYPLTIEHQVVAVVELQFSVEAEVRQNDSLRFLMDASESFERFYLRNQLRRRDVEQIDAEAERRLSDALFQKLTLHATAYALANEGRLAIGCDRLTVLVRRGRIFKAVAVSGQETFDSRSGVVRAIETLTARVGVSDCMTFFPNPADERPGIFIEDFEKYVEVSLTKRLSVAPLIPPAVTDPEGNSSSTPAVGAIVAEYFESAPWLAEERRRIERTAKTGTTAMKAALENETVFLLPVWRTLGRLRKTCLEPGTRRRTAVILAAILVSMGTLAFYPADYTAFCRGTLQPVVRRHVFAPQDGTVRHILVRHGQHVKQGDVLLEMRNTDLEIAVAEAAGRRTSLAEQMTGVERTLFDEGQRLTSEERSRLSGQRSEIREQLTSLDRQLVLYAEKRDRLKVVSPLEGEVTTWGAEHLLENRPVRQGQVLLSVADTSGAWELELRVPEGRSGRLLELQPPLRVTFSPALDPGTVREGRVTEIQNSAELRGEDGNTVLVRAEIRTADLPQRRPGAEVAAHIHCGRRALGYVWLADVVDFLRAKVWFRWF